MIFDADQLQHRIEFLPLFQRLGSPLIGDNNPRFYRWEDWVGPESPGSLAIALRQQDLHDELVAPADELEWLSALQRVVKHSAQFVPYDPDEDVWHAPTAAVGFAAWSFVLEHLYVSRTLAVPSDLSAQLTWYERGHWPSSLIEGRSGLHPADYLIF